MRQPRAGIIHAGTDYERNYLRTAVAKLYPLVHISLQELVGNERGVARSGMFSTTEPVKRSVAGSAVANQ